MMATKVGSTVSSAIAMALALLLIASPIAFGQSSKTGKTTTAAKKSEKAPEATPQTSKPVARSSETTCDGALEIVPSQPVTFARKRRPKPVSSQSSS